MFFNHQLQPQVISQRENPSFRRYPKYHHPWNVAQFELIHSVVVGNCGFRALVTLLRGLEVLIDIIILRINIYSFLYMLGAMLLLLPFFRINSYFAIAELLSSQNYGFISSSIKSFSPSI